MHFITISGKDLVKTYITADEAEVIMKGKRTKSNKVEGYPICIDGKFYFKEVKSDVKQSSV